MTKRTRPSHTKVVTREEEEQEKPAKIGPSFIPREVHRRCSYAGPKGVIADYKQYRKLKDEQKKLKSEAALQVAKKCALTSRPYSADQSAKEEEQQLKEMLEGLMDDDDDAFLAQYRQKRLAEMQGVLNNLPTYGRVYELNTGSFVGEIDKEPAQVTVIVHIYEEVANGVPAILVYKNKELIGNLISISKELDNYFPPEELETYLFEHGFLPLKEDGVSTVPNRSSKIRCASLGADSD
ncbi:Phosducin-like protein [Taenia solium]|eukprot:TsM_001135500 transcript=TsM_001135500 gene=TsM_001135500